MSKNKMVQPDNCPNVPNVQIHTNQPAFIIISKILATYINEFQVGIQ